MKITKKHLDLLSGFFLIVGALVVVLTNSFDETLKIETSKFWKWIGIGIMIVGLIFKMPWIKDTKD
jgi:hypothetical protein